MNWWSVVSYRNSTSNHNKVVVRPLGGRVVSYRNSTSNHNRPQNPVEGDYVVSYRNSTSNHNGQNTRKLFCQLYLIEILHQTTTRKRRRQPQGMLYLIEILHQTTTVCFVFWNCAALYLIEILHQTTTKRSSTTNIRCCILSKFYIKPQRWLDRH